MRDIQSYGRAITHAVQDTTDKEMTRGMGWVSVGIGLAEIAAPKQLERLMGIGDGVNTGVLRTLGVREVMHGVDLLTHDDPAPGIFSRVAGDLLDGVLLGVAAAKTKRPGGFLTVAALVLPVVVADLVLAKRLAHRR